jgi:hypothetical protein
MASTEPKALEQQVNCHLRLETDKKRCWSQQPACRLAQGNDQRFDTHDIDGPLDIVGERGQAKFCFHFL